MQLPHSCMVCAAVPCVCGVQEVTLDFFGCAVKASDFSQHLAAMELLAAQVNSLQGEWVGRDQALGVGQAQD